MHSLIRKHAPETSKKQLFFTYQAPYHKIFDSTLLVTQNWARTFQIYPHAILSRYQKPAHQILVIHSKEGIKLLLLSIREADFIKNHLEATHPRHLWLIHPDGREISNHQHNQIQGLLQQQFERSLLQIQLLNGNAKYLYQKIEQTKAFFAEGNSELKWRYLTLKVEGDETQKNILLHLVSRILPSNIGEKTIPDTHNSSVDFPFTAHDILWSATNLPQMAKVQ